MFVKVRLVYITVFKKGSEETFTFTIEYYISETPKGAITELVSSHWEDIGLNVNTKEISGELQAQRAPANMMEVSLWHGDKATDVLFPHQSQQIIPNAPVWGATTWPAWGRWFSTDGEQGEEPPTEIKELHQWWAQALSEPDLERRIELGKNILKSQAENLWAIGTVGNAPHPLVVDNNLRNVPQDGLWVWDTLWSCTRDPSQIFFENGKNIE